MCRRQKITSQNWDVLHDGTGPGFEAVFAIHGW